MPAGAGSGGRGAEGAGPGRAEGEPRSEPPRVPRPAKVPCGGLPSVPPDGFETVEMRFKAEAGFGSLCGRAFCGGFLHKAS